MLELKGCLNASSILPLWLSLIFTLISANGIAQGYNSIPIPVEERQQFFLLKKKGYITAHRKNSKLEYR